MNPHTGRAWRALAAVATLACLAPLPAQAASAAREIDATYQRDRAACLGANALHERSSCLREAGAVRNEARRGLRKVSATPETRALNAMQRCANLPGDHRDICERMVHGEGVTSGSVEGGGVLRALETEVPAAPVK